MTFYEVTTDEIPEVPRGTVICSFCESGGVDPKTHLCDFTRLSEVNALGSALRRWCTANGYLKFSAEEKK